MLCAPVSDSNPALMMASTTSRTHRPFSSRSLASPSCCFSLPFETTTRRLESNMHKPCGMLLIAVSKRLASSDMSREETRHRAACGAAVGDEFDRQKGGDEQAGENPVKPCCRKSTAPQSSASRRTKSVRYKSGICKISSENAGHISASHGKADQMRQTRSGFARTRESTTCQAARTDAEAAARSVFPPLADFCGRHFPARARK